MKAAVYLKYGPPEVLQIREIEKPVPESNEILVKIIATTVTSGDVRLRKADPLLVRGINGLIKPRKKILGVEFSGVVESIGNNVTKFKVNDQVFGSVEYNFGTYLEYKCLSQDGIIDLKPDNLSFEEASAVCFGGLASLHFLKKGNIQSGQKILIHGASGSLGTAAIQLAKYFGLEVTAVCSTSNIELVKSLGADHVIDYSKNSMILRNEDFDIIYDTIGNSSFSDSLRSLKREGYYLRAVNISPGSILKSIWTNIATSKKVVGGVAKDTEENLTFLKQLIVDGKFRSVVDKVYSLSEIVEAHSYVEKGHKKGNVVIRVSDPNVI